MQATEEKPEFKTLEQRERDYIARILRLTKGNKLRAARVLGIDRRTLYRKLARYAQEQAEAR
jgi:DNA-binding NtrC family response regulator